MRIDVRVDPGRTHEGLRGRVTQRRGKAVARTTGATQKTRHCQIWIKWFKAAVRTKE